MFLPIEHIVILAESDGHTLDLSDKMGDKRKLAVPVV
jgi:hypothetical protein